MSRREKFRTPPRFRSLDQNHTGTCSAQATLADKTVSILHALCADSQLTTMAAQRGAVKTTYALERTLQPIYSGGSVSLSEDGRILAACLGEDAMLTDLQNGRELGRTEGVRSNWPLWLFPR